MISVFQGEAAKVVEVNSKRYADTLVFTITGRVDHDSAEDLKGDLLTAAEGCRAEGDRLVIDLGGVEYISSIGLRTLMVAAKTVKAQSGVLVVANPTSVVREILEISRFNLVFDIYASVPEALGSVSPAAAAAYEG